MEATCVGVPFSSFGRAMLARHLSVFRLRLLLNELTAPHCLTRWTPAGERSDDMRKTHPLCPVCLCGGGLPIHCRTGMAPFGVISCRTFHLVPYNSRSYAGPFIFWCQLHRICRFPTIVSVAEALN